MMGSTAARTELAGGLAALGLTAVAASRRARPGLAGWELTVFRTLNRLPDGLHAPIWGVMQFGALGAAPATAAVAFALGRRPLAARLLVGGTSAWLAAKLVKRIVGRGRPATVLTDLRVRGTHSADGGFPSGHAAVATTLAAAGLVQATPRARLPLAAVAATVGAARVYVGAHLPLDVLGGTALGVALGGASRLIAPDASSRARRAHPSRTGLSP